MLGILSIRRYRIVPSGRYGDNVSGAGNQQERLIQIGWVCGFVDGEGCFSIGFARQAGGTTRKGYRVGYQVLHRFAVTQGVSSLRALEDLHGFFEVGRVYRNPRHDNHREDLAQFIVNRREELLGTVIPFFEAHPLRTAKQADFEKFARCMRLVARGDHLSAEGLVRVAEVAQTMNRRTSRLGLIRILRGHTPEVQDTGS
jgi:hypothetical protein